MNNIVRYLAGIIIGFLAALIVLPNFVRQVEKERLVVIRIPVAGYGNRDHQENFSKKLIKRLFGNAGQEPGN